MILTNLKPVGRYVNPETGNPVNVHCGVKDGSTIVYFWYYRQQRRCINNFYTWRQAPQ